MNTEERKDKRGSYKRTKSLKSKLSVIMKKHHENNPSHRIACSNGMKKFIENNGHPRLINSIAEVE